MGRRSRIFIALLMAMVLVIGVCGCKSEKAGEEKEPEKTEEKATSFSGNLIDAQGPRLVVKDPRMAMIVYTTGDTEYDLQGEKELCIGDKITVDYHKTEGKYFADKVTLDEHKEKALVFGGEVTEIGKTYVTAQSESLTVVFNTDEDTEIVGDLTEGDAVTITYEGNLSTNPLAKSIVVVQEQEEKLEKSLHGTVSEVAKKSFVVSVDSAHACRIKLTPKTKITGDAKDLKIGDEVNLLYKGDIEKDAEAVSIKVKRSKKNYFFMDGVIVKASSDKLVIQTAKKKYTFKIVEGTRIENREYMKTGHKTTITYIGKLDKDPTAASIFCSKDTVTEEEAKKSKKKDSSKKDSKKEKKKDDKKKDDKKDEDEDIDPEDPDVVLIEANGEIVKWEDPCVIKLEGGATLKLDIKDAYVSAGYVPQPGDQVIITYEKSSMKLLEIQLEYRPVVDLDTVVIDEEDAQEEATVDGSEDAAEETE